METMKCSKVLVVMMCIRLLHAMPLQDSSIRNGLRNDIVELLKELLRELRRDLLDEELNKTRRCFWRSYQVFRIPKWLHNCYVDVLQIPPVAKGAESE